MKILPLLIGIVSLTLYGCSLALAQDISAAVPSTIDLGPLFDILVSFAAALASVALGLISRFVMKKTGIELDLKHNATINEAIYSGIGFARSRLAAVKTIQTNNKLAAIAATYVISGAPKALAHFNITPERLAEMIEARLAPDQVEFAVEPAA